MKRFSANANTNGVYQNWFFHINWYDLYSQSKCTVPVQLFEMKNTTILSLCVCLMFYKVALCLLLLLLLSSQFWFQ